MHMGLLEVINRINVMDTRSMLPKMHRTMQRVRLEQATWMSSSSYYYNSCLTAIGHACDQLHEGGACACVGLGVALRPRLEGRAGVRLCV